MVRLARHYVDPRLVALYDIENASRDDTDFYLALADELHAHRIVDVGCGTGVLTRELAAGGRQVVGVDPAPAMLAVARQQPGADRVRWVEGDVHALRLCDVDLVIMTGNVAQVFLEDAEWLSTLRAFHTALRPGGHLAFESRNPDDRPWERWTREATHERFDSPNGPMETWLEVVGVSNGRVHLEGHNVFLSTGEGLVARDELRFRSFEELAGSLLEAGFTIENVYGDWQKGPLLDSSRAMIFIARRD
ncbi:MAG TPA: class I SAM-dependent methyltransferase [Chloroflexota bacterium]|nr:class I SAM-dependent methyltransferase [Chloroflexota bacterium]